MAGISSNVTSVAGNSTNINAVAGNATNINAVNANSTNINTVATNNTAINSVYTNMTAVTSAYTNIAAIIDAPTQAANAASSAAQAAASAASGMYSAVQDKSANYTILAADAGDLIRVTTTSGAITITLPLIGSTGITDGFKIAVVKWTSDANAVNIARSGSNTINGATSAQIGSQYSQIIFVADAETSTWFASQSGLGATNVNIDNFSGNGSTTAFTLTSDPSTENNTAVYISGVYQQKNTYSVSGTTLTFSTAPPTGTTNIEVAYSSPLAIGTPSDGTVGIAKLSATGTPSSSTFLRGDNSWQTVAVTPTAVSDQANSSTGYFGLPSGTTAQRPGSPVNGMIRYNSTLNASEIYQNGSWSVINYAYSVSTLVVAGGGGGGRDSYLSGAGGGGGAGGLISSSVSFTSGITYSVTVGAGGASVSTGQKGNNGSNSVLSGGSISTQTAIGGGGGGGGSSAGNLSIGSGGSGGGGNNSNQPNGASGTSGQGYAGGNYNDGGAGGGGGSSAVGGNAGGAGGVGGAGGNGTASSITGTSVTYAGGGGGSSTGAGSGGTPGTGGAGTGSSYSNYSATSATANTGSGGGGGSNGSYTTSGAGGSGVVILSIPTVSYTGISTGSPTITTSGSNTILKFTSSGTYTA